MSPKRIAFLTLVAALPGLAATPVDAARGVAIEAAVGVAPNCFAATEDFDTWTSNALAALRAGTKHHGDTSAPTGFSKRNKLPPGAFVVSSFKPTWMALADPVSVFGPAFAEQFGNRVHWVFSIRGADGGALDVADGVTVTVDDNRFFPSGGEFILNSYLESAAGCYLLIGIDYGPDRVAGSADDVVLTSGSGAVDEIVSFFPGIAVACDHHFGCSPDQSGLDTTVEPLRSSGADAIKVCTSFAGGKRRCRIGVLNGNGSASEARGTGVPSYVLPE